MKEKLKHITSLSLDAGSISPERGIPTVLVLTYDDGRSQRVDFAKLASLKPILEPLLAPGALAAVRLIDGGYALEWDCGLDMSARSLAWYAALQAGETIEPQTFKAWRKRLGLSQVTAGKALGLTARTIQNYESGSLDIPKHIVLACLGHSVSRGIPGALTSVASFANTVEKLISVNEQLGTTAKSAARSAKETEVV
jgi:DNA-binding XRE family transcriptional regulator